MKAMPPIPPKVHAPRTSFGDAYPRISLARIVFEVPSAIEANLTPSFDPIFQVPSHRRIVHHLHDRCAAAPSERRRCRTRRPPLACDRRSSSRCRNCRRNWLWRRWSDPRSAPSRPGLQSSPAVRHWDKGTSAEAPALELSVAPRAGAVFADVVGGLHAGLDQVKRRSLFHVGHDRDRPGRTLTPGAIANSAGDAKVGRIDAIGQPRRQAAKRLFVLLHGQRDLMQVAGALIAPRRFAGRVHRRKQ